MELFWVSVILFVSSLFMANGLFWLEVSTKNSQNKKLQSPSQIGMRYTNYTLRNYLKWIQKDDKDQTWENEHKF